MNINPDISMTFELAVVAVLIGGYISAKAAGKAKLPPVLGMTLFGVTISLLQGRGLLGATPPLLEDIIPSLKSLALVVILLRAGLGIHLRTLKKIGLSAVLLSFVPMLMEALAVTAVSMVLFSWDAGQALLLGFLLAAVSPAVVVPSMLELKEKRYGEKNDVPTLVLAGASLDDVLAISLFTIVLHGFTGEGSPAGSPIQTVLLALGDVGLSLTLGILPGIAAGLILLWLFRRYHQSIRATEKTLLLLGSALALFSVGQSAHTAALLGIMTMGFILLRYHPPAARELGAKLGKAWIFAEILLFVFIGMAVDIDIALEAGLRGLIIIAVGLAARAIGVLISCIPSPLNWKERLFVIVSYIPKATVQAALGAVPLAAGIPGGEQMLATAVLAIVVTAPLGLLGIRSLSPRLLDITLGPQQEP